VDGGDDGRMCREAKEAGKFVAGVSDGERGGQEPRGCPFIGARHVLQCGDLRVEASGVRDVVGDGPSRE
jgi:hypothetical protein